MAAASQEPAEGELRAFYLGQKDPINRPFDEIKPQLRQNLKQLQSDQVKQAFLAKLREKYKVAVLLSPPRADVSTDTARLRGNSNAPVTIVEFSDFQCPYCQKSQSTISELLTRKDTENPK